MREYWKTINCPNRTYENYSGEVINCPSRDYQLYAYEIDPNAYAEDRKLVERIRDGEARELAKRANDRDTAGRIRSWRVKLKDAYLGVLAENLIVEYLQNQYGQEAHVDKERFVSHDTHVDIKINWNTGDPTTIEVRSSFASNSMPRVIRKTFDHLGPYTTVYKSYEPPKDYYLRGILFEGQVKNSFSYDRKHILYFAGGVPHHWFKRIGQIKKGRNMKVVDLKTAERLHVSGKETLYMTVPIPQGLDATQIINQIRSFPKVVQKQSEISAHF